jgi:hypothetical protein
MENEAKYNELCRMADRIIDRYKPCRINKDGECIAYRFGCLPKFKTCCRVCRHQNDKGCTQKILGCKLHFCGMALNNIPLSGRENIETIRNKGVIYGFHMILGQIQE